MPVCARLVRVLLALVPTPVVDVARGGSLVPVAASGPQRDTTLDSERQRKAGPGDPRVELDRRT